MINLTINNVPVEVPEGAMVMERFYGTKERT